MFLTIRRLPSSATSTSASLAGRLSSSSPSPSTSSALVTRHYHIISSNVPACRYLTLAARPSNHATTSSYRLRPLTSIRSLHAQPYLQQQASGRYVEEDIEEEYAEEMEEEVDDADDLKPTGEGPVTKFQDLADRGLVDENVIHTVNKTMGLETMTQVQSQTLQQALEGRDVLAQAKTGTGKTIGFLLPVLQRILNADKNLALPQKMSQRKYGRATDIHAIIVSPTRELAEQIAVEARTLVQDTSVIVQTAVGGTQKRHHLREMQTKGCHILVGTPGRLKDILSDRSAGVDVQNLSAFVLDEADRLMDQGFWPEIQEIQNFLPPKSQKDRQTLMYSATLPREVVKLVRATMKPDLHYFAAVQGEELPTHERVKQSLIKVPSFENWLPTLLELCKREIAAAEETPDKQPFKAIVYFNATAETGLAYRLFLNIRTSRLIEEDAFQNVRMFGIHSRLTQVQRTAAAEHFRRATSAILFSSDVTARGMDFPNVTHVIQVGLPGNRETYIHRLGRTARAGREGEGWLILADPMVREARARLGKLLPAADTTLESANVNYASSMTDTGEDAAGMTSTAQGLFRTISEAAKSVNQEDFRKTYLAYLGIFQWVKDKQWLVDSLNRLAKVQWGMHTPPDVSSKLIQMLGLSRIAGINKSRGPPPDGSRDGRFGSSGGRGGFRDRSSSTSFSSGGSFNRSRSGGFGGRDRDFDRPRSGGFGRPDFESRPSGGRSRDFERPSFGGGNRRGGRGGDGYGGSNEDRRFEKPSSFNGF